MSAPTATALANSADAADYVTRCLDTWDTSGREQLHDSLKGSVVVSDDGTTHQVSPAFVSLLRALLASHATAPKLHQTAFQSIFDTLVPPPQATADDAQTINSSVDSPGPSQSRAATPSIAAQPSSASLPAEATFQKLPRDLSDLILDVIWAVDVEIEIRREIAEAADSQASDESKGKAKGKDTPAEEAKAARFRLAELIRDLITSRHFSRIAVAERLDVPLLVAIGLVPDETMFNKKGVRINTTNLYKQQKFNLLREENEGYSGLINELLGGMGPEVTALYDIPFDEDHNWQTAPVRVVEQEKPEERNRRARAIMRNISALIGYFDLDPNRVLDIILDVFSTNVTLHWPFFIALLCASPWGKARQQRTPPQADGMDLDTPQPVTIGEVKIDAEAGRGNNTCAQLLGFKLDYYRQQDTREDVPNELYLMSALLISQGFVRFADIWPHLSPDEDGMKKMHSSYTTALKDKAANARGNALTMAAPLADDDDAGGAKQDAAKAKQEAAAIPPKDPPNQVAGLLRALLSLGQLSHALFILSLYPWLVGAFPSIADLLLRLLKRIVKPAYDAISCTANQSVFSEEFVNAPRMRFDARRQALVQSSPPRLVPTGIVPEPASTATHRFVFAFGSGWTEGLPTCQSKQDVLDIFLPLLRMVGVHLHRDLELFQQVCRLGRSQLRAQPLSDEVKSAWLETIRFHLFPALSLTSENSGLLNELWAMLRTLPYTERFSLYGEWKNELYKRPEVRFRQLETEKEAKGILKRISKDNLKISGRALAKASHANPLIFFTIALNQVQVYDNMIPHIVECAKYLTLLEYDVFSFNLIDALSNPEKERTKQDGTNISLWLKSLASFTGTLYRRYTMIDPIPVLQYIANQLKANNSKDLVIIREMVLKMSGIEPLANLADKQIAALSGGRLLRMEAMMAANAGPGTQARQQIKRTGARLMDALKESRLAVALLILIAQQRQVCVHLVPEQDAHLRYLGNLADSCQEVLFQYVEFLHSQLDPSAYAELVPSLKALCVRFSIEPAIAFHIGRPRLLHAMQQADDAEAAAKLRAELLAIKAKAKAASPVEKSAGEGEEEVKQEGTANGVDVEMADVAENGESHEQANGVLMAADGKPVWRSGLEEALESAEAILEDEVKAVLSPHFYATFWQLSLADIQVPSERYEQEIRVVQQLMKDHDTGDANKKSPTYLRHQQSLEQLRAELKTRMTSHQNTRRRLAREKDHWFADNGGLTRPALVQHLLQHCIIPRALLSPTDAMFSGKFIRLMHLNGARNFSSLTLYDRVFIEHIAPLLFSCTENEANSYARFLQVVLDDLMPWYKSEATFKKEVHGENLPGFQLRWGERRGGQGEVIPQDALCTYDQFKGVLRKWHDYMRGAFKTCLNSGDFMRIRNAIAVMNRIAGHFPLFDPHGQDLIGALEGLVANEERGSLKVLGQGLLATLKKHSSGWVGKPVKKVAPAEAKAKVADKKGKAGQGGDGKASKAASTAAPTATDSKSKATTQTQSSTPTPAKQSNDNEPEEGEAEEGTAKAVDEKKASTAAPAKATSPPPPTEPARSKPASASTPTPTVPSGPKGRSNANTSVPSGPAADRGRSASTTQQRQSPPTGPSGARGGAGKSSAPPVEPRANGNDNRALPQRPGQGQQSRANSSTVLPTRPNRDEGQAQSPPTGPRDRTREEAAPDRAAPAGTESKAINDARQAALDSRMNPPAAPAAAATGGRNQREREREPTAPRGTSPPASSNTWSTYRDGRNGRDESSVSGASSRTGSRDTSPKPRRGAGDESPRSRNNGRDAAPVTAREREREREREKTPRERERERERDRDRDDRRRTDLRRTASDRYANDRERERERERDRERERERDREVRDRDRNGGRDRGRDARGYGGRDSREGTAAAGGAEDTSRRDQASAPASASSPPTGPSRGQASATQSTPSTTSQEAATGAYERRRLDRDRAVRDDRIDRAVPTGPRARDEVPPTSSTATRPEAVRGGRDEPAMPSGPRSDRDRDRDARRPSGPSAERVDSNTPGNSSPTGSLKRSLADRLSFAQQQQESAADAPGPESKRMRIDRNRFGPVDREREERDRDREDRAIPSGPSAAPVRSFSISGSAARERERRDAERERERERERDSGTATPTGPGGRRKGGRRENEDRSRNRARRRAGEE